MPLSTLYGLEKGKKGRRVCMREAGGEGFMIRHMAMQIHRSDGYREHYALLRVTVIPSVIL